MGDHIYKMLTKIDKYLVSKVDLITSLTSNNQPRT